MRRKNDADIDHQQQVTACRLISLAISETFADAAANTRGYTRISSDDLAPTGSADLSQRDSSGRKTDKNPPVLHIHRIAYNKC